MRVIKWVATALALAAASVGAQAASVPYLGGYADPGEFTFGGGAFVLPTESSLTGDITFSGTYGKQGPDSFDMVIYLTEGAASLSSSAKVKSLMGDEAAGALVWDFSFNNVASGTYKLWYSGYTNDTPIASLGGNFTVSSVPEPESYAMLLAGLGALGFVARRRKAPQV